VSERPEAGYELVHRDGYVHVAIRGRPQLGMVVEMFGELDRLATAESELLVLIDESEMKAALLGPSELRAMIDSLKQTGLRARSRIAIYAPSNLVYGLNRMAQAFAGEAWEGRLAVFRTENAAEEWLLGGDASRE
jgi:hypothetical protein